MNTSNRVMLIVGEIASTGRVVTPEELLLVMQYSDDKSPPLRMALHAALAGLGYRMGEQNPIDLKSTLEWCRAVTDCLNFERQWGQDHLLTKSTRANLFMLSLNLFNRSFTNGNAQSLIELAEKYFPS